MIEETIINKYQVGINIISHYRFVYVELRITSMGCVTFEKYLKHL